MKHMRLKKQTVLKSYMRWKRKKRTSETANCISLQKRRYIFCRKTLFTTKHKTLKRQKKGKKATFENDGLWPFFFSSEATSSFLKKKMYVNGEVKKKYQLWCEKHHDFFGNFFIILASNTNFVSKNLNLRRPTKISLKNLFFLAKQHVLLSAK